MLSVDAFVNFGKFTIAESCPALVRLRRQKKWLEFAVEKRETNECIPGGIRGAGCVGDSLIKRGEAVREIGDLGLNIFQCVLYLLYGWGLTSGGKLPCGGFSWKAALRRLLPRDLAPAVVQVRACRVDTGALCYQAKLVSFE